MHNNADLLTHIFSTLRLQSHVYFWAVFHGEFAVGIPKNKQDIRFHLLLDGECILKVAGQNTIHLHPGDFVLIPHGAEQCLMSDEHTVPTPLEDAINHGTKSRESRLRSF